MNSSLYEFFDLCARLHVVFQVRKCLNGIRLWRRLTFILICLQMFIPSNSTARFSLGMSRLASRGILLISMSVSFAFLYILFWNFDLLLCLWLYQLLSIIHFQHELTCPVKTDSSFWTLGDCKFSLQWLKWNFGCNVFTPNKLHGTEFSWMLQKNIIIKSARLLVSLLWCTYFVYFVWQRMT